MVSLIEVIIFSSRKVPADGLASPHVTTNLCSIATLIDTLLAAMFSSRLYYTLQRFCGLKGHEMFCEVERSYIEDGFNLYGLRACVSNFSDCLDLILDRIGPDDSDDSHLTQSACTLYGLIHARYIITAHGLDAMYNKVRNSEVEYCRGGAIACPFISFFLQHFRRRTSPI